MSKRKELEAANREAAMKAIFDSGMLNEKTTIEDILQASKKIDPGTVGWTLVYDSDNWAIAVP